MPKVSKFICDGASGARCESEVTENGFTVNALESKLQLTVTRMNPAEADFEDLLYFCSEGCLLKYLTQAIRELK